MYSNIVTKQTSRGIGPSLQRKNFNSQFKHFVMNENIGGSMNKVKKSVDIAPRIKHDTVELKKTKELDWQTIIDCSLILHKTQGVPFRDAVHSFLDVIIDAEFQDQLVHFEPIQKDELM